MNRKIFFQQLRKRQSGVFGTKLSQKQVDGLSAILDGFAAAKLTDARWLAYMLATAYHETARTMQPIAEYGSAARANKLYGIEGRNPSRARKMGNTERGDGYRYRGRGYVQLTWKTNYRKASRKLGFDFVKEPEFALNPEMAAKIMFAGMAEGWFTGKRLSDYFTDRKTDWHNARRIINGTDKAAQIAAYARGFHGAIEAAGGVPIASMSISPLPPLPQQPPLTIPPKTGFLAALLAFLKKWGKL